MHLHACLKPSFGIPEDLAATGHLQTRRSSTSPPLRLFFRSTSRAAARPSRLNRSAQRSAAAVPVAKGSTNRVFSGQAIRRESDLEKPRHCVACISRVSPRRRLPQKRIFPALLYVLNREHFAPCASLIHLGFLCPEAGENAPSNPSHAYRLKRRSPTLTPRKQKIPLHRPVQWDFRYIPSCYEVRFGRYVINCDAKTTSTKAMGYVAA